MAKTQEAMELPKITDLERMPKVRKGRQGMDLTPIIEKLRDLSEHAFEGISDEKSKERWARRVREAAAKVGLEVRTIYDPENKRLAFQGYKPGTAPAAGRKKGSKNKAPRKATKAAA